MKIALYLIMVFCGSGLLAQNLVPNASMETNTGCPSSAGQTNLATGWFNGLNSPDYHHTCSGATFGVPANVFGNQNPHHGNAYFGFVSRFISADFREHVGIQLTSPLVAGQTYLCRMRVSLADICSLGSDKLGFQFSNATTTAITNSAHVYSTVPIIDKTNWVVVSGTFTPGMAYNYVFVGNFFNDANTVTAASGSGSAAWCYYYVDSISVTPVSPLPVELVSFEGLCGNNQTTLTWTTSAEINNDEFIIERSMDGINYNEIGRVDGGGTSNAILNYDFIDLDPPGEHRYYRLKQTDFNGTIRYYDPLSIGCDEINIRVVPNPNTGLFEVIGMHEISSVSMTTLQGEVVYTSDQITSEKRIDVSWLKSGVYYLTVFNGVETTVRKVLIHH